MNNLLIDSRDIRYVLFEMLDIDSLASSEKYSAFDHDTFEAVLDLIEKTSVNECYPHFAPADREGCVYDPKTRGVTCTDSIKKPLASYYEKGFLGVVESPEIGGMGLPHSIGAALLEFISAAHQPLLMYPALAHGSMMLIDKFGSEFLRKTCIDKMMCGEWGGTMCLTETEAGSDVGRLKAKAVRLADGTYKVTGQKIFISAGENDIYKNIMHPVLARIEGDPEGTKGISIFIVPKYRFKENGEPGEQNNVVCTGIEHKMGIKSCVTCSMSFGEEGDSIGYLLGSERQGMKIMFHMMNEFRMGTAIQAQGASSAAMMHAVSYAKTRLQGTALKDMNNPSAPMVPIIQHPDVARMLLWMKSYVDAQRILIYYMFYNRDLIESSDDETAKEAQGLLDFLVPICKAGCSDTNVLITSEAMQVFGGYGFCSDYPVEQMMRNSKILAIFEGANGIQGMDLVMRKILMNPGQFNYSVFVKRINETIAAANDKKIDISYIQPLENGLKELDGYVDVMKKKAGEFRFAEILNSSTPFRKAAYMLCIAWVHLWSLTLSIPKVQQLTGDIDRADINKCLEDNNEAAFYYGKVLASQFYLRDEFPRFSGIIQGLVNNEQAVLKTTAAIFTGTSDL